MAYSESPKGLQAIPYGAFRIRLYGAKIPEMNEIQLKEALWTNGENAQRDTNRSVN